MSGRDFGRGGRGNFGDRRGSFNDRDDRRGSFRDREGGAGRDRDRGSRDFGAPQSRPWERMDDNDRERGGAPSGDRPFERSRSDRPDRDIRVERYGDNTPPVRQPREDRFGSPRDGGSRPTSPTRNEERPTPPPAEPKGAAAAAMRTSPAGWTQDHLLDSWLDEKRLQGWTPSDQDLQEMVEDNIEGDPQVPGRDRRAITVAASGGVVTLTGTVRSRAVKFAAGSDAYWTYGVNDLRNELTVQARGPQAGATPAPTPPKAKRASKAKTIVEEMTEQPLTAENTPAPEEQPSVEELETGKVNEAE